MRPLVAVLASALAATFWAATARADGISYTGGRFMFECDGQFAGFIKKIKSDNAPRPRPSSTAWTSLPISAGWTSTSGSRTS